jgi:hypothetical protein
MNLKGIPSYKIFFFCFVKKGTLFNVVIVSKNEFIDHHFFASQKKWLPSYKMMIILKNEFTDHLF